MRRFGEEAQAHLTFQLRGSDTVYQIPLAASMPVSVLLSMQEADNIGGDSGFRAQVEMLRKYMGDVVDDLTAGTLGDILKAWAQESKAQGASVGESPALSE